jgi:hypothetical protein
MKIDKSLPEMKAKDLKEGKGDNTITSDKKEKALKTYTEEDLEIDKKARTEAIYNTEEVVVVEVAEAAEVAETTERTEVVVRTVETEIETSGEEKKMILRRKKKLRV